MSVLNHIAEVAAVILLIEVLVVVLVLAGIFGGLAFGLHWVNGKTEWAFGKGNHFIGLGVRYLDKGLDFAALPVIKSTALQDRLGTTARTLEKRVRENQERRSTRPAAAAVPLTPPGTLEEPDPLV